MKISEDTIRFRFTSKRKSEQRRPDSKASTNLRLHAAVGSVGTVETNSTFGGQGIPGDFKTSQTMESMSDGRISFTSDFPPHRQQPMVCSV
jgi:hypothetical protein